MQYFKIRSFL